MAYLGKTTNYKFHYGAFSVTFSKARSLRKEMTEAERVFWDEIKNRKIDGFKFRRQHPVGQYIVDFFCDRKNLVIEIDGGIHSNPEVRERDAIRSGELTCLGLHVMRFTNEEILYNLEESLEKLRDYLKNLA